jgi:hypothetical protein
VIEKDERANPLLIDVWQRAPYREISEAFDGWMDDSLYGTTAL